MPASPPAAQFAINTLAGVGILGRRRMFVNGDFAGQVVIGGGSTIAQPHRALDSGGAALSDHNTRPKAMNEIVQNFIENPPS